LTKQDDKFASGTASSAEQESLSALIDGEANDLDMARALRGVAGSNELRAYWRRQQLIRESMAGQLASNLEIDVSEAVQTAISSEKRRYANPLMSMAVAASVTLAVVLGGQQALLFSQTPANSITAPGAIVQVPGTGAVQASFAESQVMQPRTVATPTSVNTVDPYSNRASYNRLADERFESLLKVHNTTASAASITPFVSRSVDPTDSQ
jgi:sigma-E factor negative regulatory protein RseA